MTWHVLGQKKALTANATETIELETLTDFEARLLVVAATGTFEVTEVEDQGGLDFLADVVHSSQLIDVGRRDLSPPLKLAARTKLRWTVKDLSGLANTVYIALVGDKVQK